MMDCSVGLALLAEERVGKTFVVLRNLVEKSSKVEMADKYRSSLGICYFLIGRYGEAEEACRIAMKISGPGCKRTTGGDAARGVGLSFSNTAC